MGRLEARERGIRRAQAASEGHVEAQYELALMLKEGEGVPKDWEQSMHWFHSAAVLGHAGVRRCPHIPERPA